MAIKSTRLYANSAEGGFEGVAGGQNTNRKFERVGEFS